MSVTPTREEIEQEIREQCGKFNLDPTLLIKQCKAESNFNPGAVSRVGALGLFQLMPRTAKWLEVDPHDWRENIRGGCKFMKWLLDRYDGDYPKALGGYNWGIRYVDKAVSEGRWPKYIPKETSDYIRRILGNPPSPSTPPTPAIAA